MASTGGSKFQSVKRPELMQRRDRVPRRQGIGGYEPAWDFDEGYDRQPVFLANSEITLISAGTPRTADRAEDNENREFDHPPGTALGVIG